MTEKKKMTEKEALEYVEGRYPEQQAIWRDYLTKKPAMKIKHIPFKAYGGSGLEIMQYIWSTDVITIANSKKTICTLSKREQEDLLEWFAHNKPDMWKEIHGKVSSCMHETIP